MMISLLTFQILMIKFSRKIGSYGCLAAQERPINCKKNDLDEHLKASETTFKTRCTSNISADWDLHY